jgi:tetratricopeptide (TPR) repeat protein
LVLAFFAAAGSAAAAPAVQGEYRTPIGRVRVEAQGEGYRGQLLAPAPGARLAAGDEVLRATLLDDALVGELRVPVAGAACAASDRWASVVLLVGERKLAGAATLGEAACRSEALGPRGGITFTRLAPSSPTRNAAATPPRDPTPSRRARARALVRDGAAYLHEGAHESARRRFQEAIAIDPGLPEAYNGVGASYRMRDDLPAALGWYKRALAVDPDFGDAYYNMACVYALRGERDLAVRYLQIAALNGYETAATIEEDPDLAALRGDPAWRALVGPAGKRTPAP